MGFVSALTLLFIGLKLSGLLTWSWWAVLSPMLIGAALLFLLVVVASVVYVGVAVRDRRTGKRWF